jgi:transcriptional regulator with XRE-family HTH domain
MQTDPVPSKSLEFRVFAARDLGLAVKYYRTLAGLSQVQLAERAGLHRSYLAALESGHSTEAVERLLRLFGEMGVRVNLVKEG